MVMNLLVIAAAAFAVACSSRSEPAAPAPDNLLTGALVDLSHAYSQRTVSWPTAEGFRPRKLPPA